MQVYCFLRPCDLELAWENAILSEVAEELSKFSLPLEKAFQEIKDWASLNSGQCLSSFGEQICITVNSDKMPELSQFITKYESTAKMKFAVGVGLTTLEAYKAMLASDATSGSQVVLYTPEIEEETYAQLDGELSKNENEFTLDFPNMELEKDDPTQVQQPPEDPHKAKLMQALIMVRDNSQSISQLKASNPEAFNAVKSLIEIIMEMAQNTKKSESSWEESSSDDSEESSGSEEDLDKALPMPQKTPKAKNIVGQIKNDRHGPKIRVQARDISSRAIIGEHDHNIRAGMRMSNSGHPTNAQKEGKNTDD